MLPATSCSKHSDALALVSLLGSRSRDTASSSRTCQSGFMTPPPTSAPNHTRNNVYRLPWWQQLPKAACTWPREPGRGGELPLPGAAPACRASRVRPSSVIGLSRPRPPPCCRRRWPRAARACARSPRPRTGRRRTSRPRNLIFKWRKDRRFAPADAVEEVPVFLPVEIHGGVDVPAAISLNYSRGRALRRAAGGPRLSPPSPSVPGWLVNNPVRLTNDLETAREQSDGQVHTAMPRHHRPNDVRCRIFCRS